MEGCRGCDAGRRMRGPGRYLARFVVGVEPAVAGVYVVAGRQQVGALPEATRDSRVAHIGRRLARQLAVVRRSLIAGDVGSCNDGPAVPEAGAAGYEAGRGGAADGVTVAVDTASMITPRDMTGGVLGASLRQLGGRRNGRAGAFETGR